MVAVDTISTIAQQFADKEYAALLQNKSYRKAFDMACQKGYTNDVKRLMKLDATITPSLETVIQLITNSRRQILNILLECPTMPNMVERAAFMHIYMLSIYRKAPDYMFIEFLMNNPRLKSLSWDNWEAIIARAICIEDHRLLKVLSVNPILAFYMCIPILPERRLLGACVAGNKVNIQLSLQDYRINLNEVRELMVKDSCCSNDAKIIGYVINIVNFELSLENFEQAITTSIRTGSCHSLEYLLNIPQIQHELKNKSPSIVSYCSKFIAQACTSAQPDALQCLLRHPYVYPEHISVDIIQFLYDVYENKKHRPRMFVENVEQPVICYGILRDSSIKLIDILLDDPRILFTHPKLLPYETDDHSSFRQPGQSSVKINHITDSVLHWHIDDRQQKWYMKQEQHIEPFRAELIAHATTCTTKSTVIC